MAFTWEVEALRKMVDAIVEEAKWAEIGDVDDWQFDIDKKKVEEIDKSIEKRSPATDAFMKALSNVPSDEAKRRRLEDEEEALEAIINEDRTPDEVFIGEVSKQLSEKEDAQNKLKLDWVNEILQEFPEDKAPEVLRLPHLKDEEKPDMSPFLSYLLRQSPYARLPAAGLLGLGLMGYSKPAY